MNKKIYNEDLTLNLIINANKMPKGNRQALSELEKLDQKTQKLRLKVAELELAKRKLDKTDANYARNLQILNRQLKANEQQIRANEAAMQGMRTKIGLAGMTINQLNTHLRVLNTMLRNTSSNAVRINLRRQIAETEMYLKKAMTGAGRLSQAWTELARKANRYSAAIGWVTGTMYLVGSAVATVIQRLGLLDRRLSGVMKTTGLTREEARRLKKEFDQLPTPTTTEHLLDMARIAGKLGIEGYQNIKKFTGAVDILYTALSDDLNLSVEETAEKVGKLVNAFRVTDKLPIDEALLRTGSLLNQLDKSSVASAGTILEYMTRLSSLGTSANYPMEQLAGLAATLETVNIPAERGSTALRNIIGGLGKNVDRFRRFLNMTTEEYKKAVETDINDIFLKLLEATAKGDKSIIDVIKSMGDFEITGVRVAEVYGALSKNLDIVRQQQDIATQSFKNSNSVMSEYLTIITDYQGTLDMQKKRVRALFDDFNLRYGPIGLKIYRMWVDMLYAIRDLMRWVEVHMNQLKGLIFLWTTLNSIAIVKWFTRLTGSIIPLTFRMVGLGKAFQAFKLMIGASMSGNVFRAISIIKLLTRTMNPLQLGLAALVALIGSVGTAVYFLKGKTDLVKKAFAELSKNMRMQMGQMNALFDTIMHSKKGSDTQVSAIKALNELYAKYLPRMITERDSLYQIASAREKANQALEREIALKWQNEQMGKIDEGHMSKIQKYSKRLLKDMDGYQAGVAARALGEMIESVQYYQGDPKKLEEFARQKGQEYLQNYSTLSPSSLKAKELAKPRDTDWQYPLWDRVDEAQREDRKNMDLLIEEMLSRKEDKIKADRLLQGYEYQVHSLEPLPYGIGQMPFLPGQGQVSPLKQQPGNQPASKVALTEQEFNTKWNELVGREEALYKQYGITKESSMEKSPLEYLQKRVELYDEYLNIISKFPDASKEDLDNITSDRSSYILELYKRQTPTVEIEVKVNETTDKTQNTLVNTSQASEKTVKTTNIKTDKATESYNYLNKAYREDFTKKETQLLEKRQKNEITWQEYHRQGLENEITTYTKLINLESHYVNKDIKYLSQLESSRQKAISSLDELKQQEKKVNETTTGQAVNTGSAKAGIQDSVPHKVKEVKGIESPTLHAYQKFFSDIVYSQVKRYQEGYADCSSAVTKLLDIPNKPERAVSAEDIYRGPYTKNKRATTASDLIKNGKDGQLVFMNADSENDEGKKYGIDHVGMIAVDKVTQKKYLVEVARNDTMNGAYITELEGRLKKLSNATLYTADSIKELSSQVQSTSSATEKTQGKEHEIKPVQENKSPNTPLIPAPEREATEVEQVDQTDTKDKAFEAEFQKWWNSNKDVLAWRKDFVKQYGEEPSQQGDYDYRGAYKAGITPKPDSYDKGHYHWESIGLNGVNLKGENHPTRWKSDFMEATGINPDEKYMTFSEAVRQMPALEKYRSVAEPPITTKEQYDKLKDEVAQNFYKKSNNAFATIDDVKQRDLVIRKADIDFLLSSLAVDNRYVNKDPEVIKELQELLDKAIVDVYDMEHPKAQAAVTATQAPSYTATNSFATYGQDQQGPPIKIPFRIGYSEVPPIMTQEEYEKAIKQLDYEKTLANTALNEKKISEEEYRKEDIQNQLNYYNKRIELEQIYVSEDPQVLADLLNERSKLWREQYEAELEAEKNKEKKEDKLTREKKEAQQKLLEEKEAEHAGRLTEIKYRYLKGEIKSEDDYNDQLLKEDIRFFSEKMKIFDEKSKEYMEAYNEFMQVQVDANKKFDEKMESARKMYSKRAKPDKMIDDVQLALDEEEDRWAEEKTTLEQMMIVKPVLEAKDIEYNDLIQKIIKQQEEEHQKKKNNIEAVRQEPMLGAIDNILKEMDYTEQNTQFWDKNVLEERFKYKMDLLKKQQEIEQNMNQGNQEKLNQINAHYASMELQMKQDLFDAEKKLYQARMEMADAYISALISVVGQESDVGRSLFLLQQALAIAKIWVETFAANAAIKAKAVAMFSYLGPYAPAAAAAWVAAPIAANNMNALLNTGLIAAQTVGSVGQWAEGKYPVKGEDDGITYQADWTGDAKTGLYTRPSLIAEKGPEMVIDYPTLKNIRLKSPELIQRIMDMRVPQHYGGKYPEPSYHSSLTSLPVVDNKTVVQPGQLSQQSVDDLTLAIREFMQYRPSLDIRYFEKMQKEYQRATKGGLK